MKNDGKFTLEFDKPPSLIYVAEGENVEHIYLQGHRVRYWHSLRIESDAGEITEYEIKGYPLD